MLRETLALVGCAFAAAASAQTTVSYSAPNFDRWNYPFNFTPGIRTAVSTFSSGIIPGQFDDRDAQFLNSFITAGDFNPGLGALNYLITSATATATLTGGEFSYSSTFAEGGSIDLFGTGFRNGLNAFAYGDSFAFSFGDPTLEGVRNAYATDNAGGSLRDVSNNTRDGFAPTPFAVGQIVGETTGTTVTGSGQLVEFTLDLANPDVVSYLQNALNTGILSLSITSTHTAAQGGPIVFPVFGTNEGGSPMTLDLTVEIVPTPASTALIGLGALAGLRRRR